MTRSLIVLLAITMLVLSACGSSRESAEADTMTAHVGQYPPPPAGAFRPRVGIPQFKVSSGEVSNDTAVVAADQLSTLCVMSQRFDVIERAQLEQLLSEQNLAGVVKEGEVAKAAQIRGVNYLMLGKITNFRVKAEKSSGGFNLASLGGHFGAFDYQNTKSVITVECGVDLRLVDPESGSTAAAHFGEYKRTDSLSSFGVGVLGYHNENDATLKLDKDNEGKVLRLALDEALRKMLPQIDSAMVARANQAPAGG
jgi:curli biogenesis system outer membrane secretion channel CsgG